MARLARMAEETEGYLETAASRIGQPSPELLPKGYYCRIHRRSAVPEEDKTLDGSVLAVDAFGVRLGEDSGLEAIVPWSEIILITHAEPYDGVSTSDAIIDYLRRHGPASGEGLRKNIKRRKASVLGTVRELLQVGTVVNIGSETRPRYTLSGAQKEHGLLDGQKVTAAFREGQFYIRVMEAAPMRPPNEIELNELIQDWLV